MNLNFRAVADATLGVEEPLGIALKLDAAHPGGATVRYALVRKDGMPVFISDPINLGQDEIHSISGMSVEIAKEH
jgi:hypothetical protein